MSDIKCKDPFKNCDDWECQKAGACQSSAPTLEIGHLHDKDFIVVHEVIENDDGTASVQLDLGANALRMLVEIGFVAMLKQGLAMGQKTHDVSDEAQT